MLFFESSQKLCLKHVPPGARGADIIDYQPLKQNSPSDFQGAVCAILLYISSLRVTLNYCFFSFGYFKSSRFNSRSAKFKAMPSTRRIMNSTVQPTCNHS